MSRLEEIRENQSTLNNVFKAINGAEIDITQDALTNLNLSAITAQLVDISTTLAIIADKLGLRIMY